MSMPQARPHAHSHAQPQVVCVACQEAPVPMTQLLCDACQPVLAQLGLVAGVGQAPRVQIGPTDV